ncbi:MAG TPA: PIN domain-containing protein [Terracidiphilus sp.]|nr:PIN domain-containing protein [Terracidiphilus sp.]
MILVDTSIWIDHLRKPEPRLKQLLENDDVATHPYIILELALGSIANRAQFLKNMALLHHMPVAEIAELRELIEQRRLFRRGIDVTDIHLIASVLFSQSIRIWTRDRRLGELAEELGIRAAVA